MKRAMAAVRFELIGGPLDGLLVAPRPATYVWIAAVGAGARAYDDPDPGRYLYRRSGQAFVFAGYQYRKCSGCGAYICGPSCALCLHR